MLHNVQDALSRLLHSLIAQASIDDAFPYDLFSRNPLECAGPNRGNLDGMLLVDLMLHV